MIRKPEDRSARFRPRNQSRLSAFDLKWYSVINGWLGRDFVDFADVVDSSACFAESARAASRRKPSNPCDCAAAVVAPATERRVNREMVRIAVLRMSDLIYLLLAPGGLVRR